MSSPQNLNSLHFLVDPLDSIAGFEVVGRIPGNVVTEYRRCNPASRNLNFATMADKSLLAVLALLVVFNAATATRNFSDGVYEVCVNPWAPIMSCNATTNTFKGLDVQEFDAIAGVLQWKRVQPGDSCKEGQQCYRYKCLTLEEVEKDLKSPNGDCHMGTSLSVSNERIEAGMTFSFPIFRGKLDILTKAEFTRGNGWGFTRPVTWGVWLTILFTGLLLVPTLLVVFEYISEQETFPRSLSDVAGGISKAWWNSVTTLLQMDAASVRSAEAKIIMLGYAFLVLIIVTSYTANMTANLTINKIKANVESAADLNGKSVGTMLVDVPRFSNRDAYQFNLFGIDADASTMKVAMNMLLKDKVDALIMSSQWISKVLSQRGCKHDLYRFPLHEPFDYSLAFPVNITCGVLFDINQAIMKLSSGDSLQNIVDKFEARDKCGEARSVDPLTVFGMHHVYGVWVLMAGAVFLASIISLTRCMLKQYNKFPKFVKFKDYKGDIEMMAPSNVNPSSNIHSQNEGMEWTAMVELRKEMKELSQALALTRLVTCTDENVVDSHALESTSVAQISVTTDTDTH